MTSTGKSQLFAATSFEILENHRSISSYIYNEPRWFKCPCLQFSVLNSNSIHESELQTNFSVKWLLLFAIPKLWFNSSKLKLGTLQTTIYVSSIDQLQVWIMNWIVFMVWLIEERRLALFPAETIVRNPHHRESLQCRQ